MLISVARCLDYAADHSLGAQRTPLKGEAKLLDVWYKTTSNFCRDASNFTGFTKA